MSYTQQILNLLVPICQKSRPQKLKSGQYYFDFEISRVFANPNTFWNAYKAEKETMKKSGIMCFKDDYGRWMVKVYANALPAQSRKADFALVENLLLAHQKTHVQSLISLLLEKGVALDTSQAGSGKTYTSLACAKAMGLIPIVIAPKSTIYGWFKAFKHFSIPNAIFTTWDIFKNGKQYKMFNGKPEIVEWDGVSKISSNNIVIIDEAHRSKNSQTQNAKAIKEIAMERNLKKFYILCQSATMAENPLKGAFLTVLTDVCHTIRQFYETCGVNCGISYEIGSTGAPVRARWVGNEENMLNFTGMLAPFTRGMANPLGHLPNDLRLVKTINSTEISRELNSVIEQVSNIPKKDRKEAFDKLVESLSEPLKEKLQYALKTENTLSILLRLRQIAELEKMSQLIEEIAENIEDGYSVCIFCNFKDTIASLKKVLSESGVKAVTYTGDDNATKREKARTAFQDGSAKCIIGTLSAMREGIDLHDTLGQFHRLVYLSPSFSAQDLIQALGRVHRSGKKSESTQYVCLLEDSVEMRVYDTLSEKLGNLETLNRLNDSELKYLTESD